MERLHIEFEVHDRERFLQHLQRWDEDPNKDTGCVGYRYDDALDKRVPLKVFTDEMETVLRRHEHKRTWREKPVEALFRLLKLEVEEAAVALEFFSAAEAQHEMVDIANFACMLFDRLGMMNRDKTLKEQEVKQYVEE